MSEVYETEHLLIDLIQHYPFIYDKSLKEYKDNNMKSNAWDSIAKALDLSAEEAQRIWKNLRDKYNREKKILDAPSGSSAEDATSIWPLFKHMDFMKQHIASRKRISNVSAVTPSSKVKKQEPTVRYNDAIVADDGTIVIEGTKEKVRDNILAENTENKTSPQHTEESSVSADDVTLNITPKVHKKRKNKQTDPIVEVEETLGVLKEYMLNKQQKPDKNISFGQYVGMSLSDMPMKEQNYKKLKIVQVLNEPYLSE